MLTVVVDSFDGYSDLWAPFFQVFQKHWCNCPYRVVLVSNNKTYEAAETICVGDETCWSDRTQKAISQIDSKYILLLLEDYLLGETVNTHTIEEAISFLEQHNGNYLRLTNIPASRFHRGEATFPIYADEEYGINLQASIWRRDFLVEALSKYPGNAWEFEIGFLREAVNADHRPLAGCFGLSKDPLHIHNGVLKGKWFPKEVRYFSRLGVQIPWEKRGKLSPVQSLKYVTSVQLKAMMPYTVRKWVKPILRKMGVRFVSDL